MRGETRSERTERLLALRLEELARAVERSGASGPATTRLLELAAVATMNAVALELLTAERAEGLWRAARERHPALEQVRLREHVPQPARLAA